MVRRVHAPTSSRLLFTVISAGLCATALVAQPAESTQPRSSAGSKFVVAPSLALASAPTSVATGDLNGDGKLDMAITSKGSGNVTVLLGDGKGGFAPGVEYAAGKQPGNILLADLSGHGRLDVVVTDAAAGVVEVLAGNGDGTFGKSVAYRAAVNPVAMAAGKFGAEGRIDLAVASATGVTLLENDGQGHFTAGATMSIAGKVQSIAAADLGSNGHDDLIAAGADGNLTVLLGDGERHFTALPAKKIADGALSAIAAGDLNHDGRADLAVTQAGSNKVTVLLGRGDGTFEPGIDSTVGNRPAAVLFADFNGDGHIDVITANAAANTFSVLLGNGDGALKPAADFTAGNAPVALAAGDFHGNGHADIAILNSGDKTISVAAGNGDGTFVAAPAYRAGLEHKAVASADLNGDGLADLVVTNYCGDDAACKSAGTATVFLAQRDGSYKAGDTYSLGNGPVAVAVADLNGDRKLDLVVLNRDDKTLAVLAGDGKGKFGEAQSYTLASSPSALFVGDFNGDGRPDVAIASDCGRNTCSEPGTVEIWTGQTGGTLKAGESYTVGYSPSSIAAGDLRGTGHLDLVVANACGDDSSCKSHGTASLLAGDGKGKFTDGGEIDLGSEPASIALGKLTGAGLDLVVAERGSNQVEVMHSNGKGGFGAPVTYPVGAQPESLAIADFDGDGRLDVAVANFKDSTVSVLTGTAKGTLNAAVNYPVGAGPESLAATPSAKTGTGLVTANGNSGSTPMGTDITILARPHPEVSGTSSVALTITPATPSEVDQVLTLTAAVTTSVGTPNGNVEFAIVNSPTDVVAITGCGGTNGVTVDNNGNATCNPPLVDSGQVTYQATYLGDTNNGASSPDQATQTVNAAPTTTTVTANPAAPAINQTVTFTATVKPNVTPAPSPATNIIGFAATGTLSFFDNGTAIAGCQGITVTLTTTGATAPCAPTVSGLNAGNITAKFGGIDFDYSPSTSANFPLAAANSKTTLATSGSPSNVNDQVTFTATITAATGTTQVNIVGTVQFLSDGNSIGCDTQAVSFADVTGFTAQCQTTSLTASGSPHAITAIYTNTDGNYNGSTSNTVNQTVKGVGTTTTLTPATGTSTVDTPVTFTAVIAPSSGTAKVKISGTMNFKDGATSIGGCGSVTVDKNTEQAQCTTALLTASGSPHTITAVFTSSDNNYTGSTSNNATQTVNQANSAVVVSSSLAPSTVDQAVTYTATVTPSVTPAPSPASNIVPFLNTGSVQFFDGGNAIPGCSGANAVKVTPGSTNATATCSPSTSSANLAFGTHNITASYSGDANYNSSTTAANFPQVVNLAGTQVVISSSNASSTVDLVVTYTATVSTTVTPAPSPANTQAFSNAATVTFSDAGNQIGNCTNIPIIYNGTTGNATAVCHPTVPSLTVGTHGITASYSGDTNYSPSSTPHQFQQVVNAANTTTALSTQPTPLVSGAAATLTATISPNVTPAPNPAGNIVTFSTLGTVTFKDGGTVLSGCSGLAVTSNPTLGQATAPCPIANLTAGTHNFSAVYTGDSNYNGSNSSSSQTVSKATLTTALASSSGAGNTSTVDTQVTFTETLTPPSGDTIALQSSVVFTDNGTPLACNGTQSDSVTPTQSTPGGAATAACAVSTLTGGSQLILATYSVNNNDPNYNTASNNLTQTVNQAASTTTVKSGTNPSTINESVTFTAAVAPSNAAVGLTGSVTFFDNNAPLSCVVSFNPANGLASCTTSNLTLGSNTISAKYTGDKSYANSTGNVSQTVNAAATSLSVASSGSPSTINEQVTFTATLTAPTGNATPSKTIAFTDLPAGATSATPIPGCGTVPLTLGPSVGPNSTFTAQCPVSSLILGTHTITASYANDNDFAPSSGSTSQTVNPAKTTTTIASSSTQNTSTVNDLVNFTATVSSAPGSIRFSGTMTFTDSVSGATICSSPVNPNSGVAVCSDSALTAAKHSIEAAYGNDNNFSASNASLTQTVNAAASATTLTSSVNPSVVAPSKIDDSVTFTATVTPFTGSVKLSGSVTFLQNGSSIPECTTPVAVNPANGQATCTTRSLSAGSDAIVAIYAGDNNYTTSNADLAQRVKDFGLTLAVSSPLVVTRGSLSSKDPFSPQVISVQPSSTSQFTGTLVLSCQATVVAPTGATAPTCTMSTPTLEVTSGTTGGPEPTGEIIINASNASAGQYTITVIGQDEATGLTHIAANSPFTVLVRDDSSSLTFASGATTGNTANVSFVLPAGVGLTSIDCPTVSGPTLATPIAPVSLFISCSINPGSVAKSATSQVATVAVTVDTGGTSTAAELDRRTTIYTAGVLGLPLLALLGVVRGRKRFAAFFRLVAIAAIAIAGLQLMGCGGSFQKPPTNGGTTPPGQYDLLIEGNGTDGNKYQAVLTVKVTL